MFGNIGPLEIFVLVFLVGVFLLPAIFFLLTVRNLLLACAPQNRALEPDKVWFTLIPLFGLYWQFVVVAKAAETVENEFRATGNQAAPDTGKNFGLAMCILFALNLVPRLNLLVAIPGIVCWIIYWVKISNAKAAVLKIR